jgi:hypothetical protein
MWFSTQAIADCIVMWTKVSFQKGNPGIQKGLPHKTIDFIKIIECIPLFGNSTLVGDHYDGVSITGKALQGFNYAWKNNELT